MWQWGFKSESWSGVKSPASAWFGMVQGLRKDAGLAVLPTNQSCKPPIAPPQVGGRPGSANNSRHHCASTATTPPDGFPIDRNGEYDGDGVDACWIEKVPKKCTMSWALVERRTGKGRGRHWGRLGVLGRMTVCAIIEHPRCRSRPNDRMK